MISQPFWPDYLTAERIAKAKKLKLVITAGVGSDHVDLKAAMRRGINVAEVTSCHSISVAEHTVMLILALVQDSPPPTAGWSTRGSGLEHRRLRRPGLRSRGDAGGNHRCDRTGGHPAAEAVRRRPPLYGPAPPPDLEEELNLTFHPTVESLVRVFVSLHCPRETYHLFDEALITKMKRGRI